jgi:hypothetical protein
MRIKLRSCIAIAAGQNPESEPEFLIEADSAPSSRARVQLINRLLTVNQPLVYAFEPSQRWPTLAECGSPTSKFKLVGLEQANEYDVGAI